MVKNSKGKVYYGMHFYPGVAEYQESGKDPHRVFLNEDTIRSMDPTFAGRPVFVEHVDEVDPSIDQLRKEADGWVIESFFNSADGKHWVKFIVVSDRGEKAIMQGMRLSNAYVPMSTNSGGLWNGVSYAKEITSGEYEHLAIVKHPRYEESIIMTPEAFKLYNAEKELELKRLANSNEGERKMKLNLFKRAKVENSSELEGMSVTLPKSGKEMTIVELVEKMDKIENMHGYASGDHMVKVGENEMSVNDLVKKHMEMCNEMDEMKKVKDSSEEEGDLDSKEKKVDVEGDDKSMDNEEDKDDKSVDNEEDDEKEEKKKNEIEQAKVKKAEAKKKADAIRNAQNDIDSEPAPKLDLMEDQVARGKSRYGSK